MARRRSVIHNMLGHAVDDELFDVNPMPRSHWTAPDAVHTVDPDVVINHDQARTLLAAVGCQGDMGPRLVAFFGCMYYSALRPGEVVPLTAAAIQLPAEGWGEFRLRESTPLSGHPGPSDSQNRGVNGLPMIVSGTLTGTRKGGGRVGL